MSTSKTSSKQFSEWLGFLPFLLFCLAFEIVPVFFLLRGSMIEKTTGQLTLQHYIDLERPLYINSFLNSIKLSGLTAVDRRCPGDVHRLRHLSLAVRACP